MEKRKRFRETFMIGFLGFWGLFAGLLVYFSGAFYKLGKVDGAIFYFGLAMIVGMQMLAGIISLRLDKKLSCIEKLMEKLIERLEDKEN